MNRPMGGIRTARELFVGSAIHLDERLDVLDEWEVRSYAIKALSTSHSYLTMMRDGGWHPIGNRWLRWMKTPRVGLSFSLPLRPFFPESSFKAFPCHSRIQRSPHLHQLPSHLSAPRSHAIRNHPFRSQGLCNSPPIFAIGQVLAALLLY